MDFQMHLKFLRNVGCNVKTGILIRHVWELFKDHEGKDFKDLDDFFTKLYPKDTHSNQSAFYDTWEVESQ